ncbi:hypothetical protein C8J56DRAFT_459482 [Mycena floridula]|nr:hypothetical protein C8J56DRAFT_459482 [Mycena floridula]
MSSLKLQSSPHLSVDLLRIIFELAFEEDGGTGNRLLLVSRRARQWIEPLLYRTISLYGHQRTFQLFCALLDSNRSPFLSSHVQKLVLGPSHTTDLFIPALSACKSLQSLALRGSSKPIHLQSLKTVDLPHLRRLSLRLDNFPDPADFSSLKMLCSLTHLQLFSKSAPEIYIWTAVKQIPGLTHLWMQLPESPARPEFSIPKFVENTLVPRLPTSVKLVVVTVYRPQSRYLTELPPDWIRRCDNRVVLSTMESSLFKSIPYTFSDLVLWHRNHEWEKTWGRLPAGEIDGWIEAERLQAKIALESL